MCRLLPSPPSKLHQIKYVNLETPSNDGEELLAVSTEDGRIIFFSTRRLQKSGDDSESAIPYAEAVSQLGGKQNGLPGRVKDFEILSLRDQPKARKDDFVVITGGSDGIVRVWLLNGQDVLPRTPSKEASDSDSNTRQVGKLLNAYETGSRITCLKAFVMLPAEDASDLDESLSESEGLEESSDDESGNDDA